MGATIGGKHSVYRQVGLLFLIALAIRLRIAWQDYPLFWDELYHLLAARSWAEDGSFRVADGTYERARWWTATVGLAFRLAGDSVFVARVIPAIVGSLWVATVFLWASRLGGALTGWIAGLLFCFDPEFLVWGGYSRFYSVHGLLFFVGAVAVYESLARPLSSRSQLITISGAVLALSLCSAISLLTFIGLSGLAAWVVWKLVEKSRGTARRKRLVLALVCFGLLAGTLLLASDLGERLAHRFSWTPGWAEENASEFRYYQWLYLGLFPTLWTLLPVAVLLALRRRFDAALLCVAIFVTATMIHSIAAAKAVRYIIYTLPFFYILWALALEDLIPLVRRLADRVARLTSRPSSTRRILARSIITATFAWIILSNPGWRRSIRHLSGMPPSRSRDAGDWEAAADRLKGLAQNAGVVVTPNSLHALYYVGRYDFEFRTTGVLETMTADEFGTDSRTGRRVIGTPESLQLVIDCFGAGLIFAENSRWRSLPTESIYDAAADLVVAAAEEIALPPEWRIRAYRWAHPVDEDPEDCLARGRGAQPDPDRF